MDASHRHKLVLETICDPSSQRRLGRARHYLAQEVRKKVPDGETLSDMELMETVWALVSQGLAYIDFTEPAAENWKLLPTPAGQAVLADTHASPDDPAGYWARLVRSAPKASDIVQLYAREALDAYNHCLYQASAVMLGVASEAAVLEVARVLAAYLPAAQGEKLHKVLDSPHKSYVKKFDGFRRQLAGQQWPKLLRRNVAIMLTGIAELLRVYRNQAGHPSGVVLGRDECFAHLVVFVEYLKTVYAVKGYLEEENSKRRTRSRSSGRAGAARR